MDGRMEFVVFCIENLAEKLNMDAPEVYRKLTENTNILDDYIFPNYEILHTQGKEYIMEDIIDVMRKDGLQV